MPDGLRLVCVIFTEYIFGVQALRVSGSGFCLKARKNRSVENAARAKRSPARQVIILVLVGPLYWAVSNIHTHKIWGSCSINE